jgi:Tol biopolymer transport system component
VVNSRRNGFPNLGLLDMQTQSFSPLTNEQFVEQGAAIVPGTDGRSVVFASNRSGQFHIWRFDADTNNLRQLTFGPNYEEHPSVSPDGRWVVYTSWIQNVSQLWKVPAEGGQAAQISAYEAKDPQVSPDGKWVACYLNNQAAGKWSIALVAFDGNGEPRAVPQATNPVRWSPDGMSLISVRTDARGLSNVWRIPLNGGVPIQLTAFEDQSIPVFAWSPGGDRLACLRVSVGADVMLFKLGKQQ